MPASGFSKGAVAFAAAPFPVLLPLQIGFSDCS
jgi:hypothetical protein